MAAGARAQPRSLPAKIGPVRRGSGGARGQPTARRRSATTGRFRARRRPATRGRGSSGARRPTRRRAHAAGRDRVPGAASGRRHPQSRVGSMLGRENGERGRTARRPARWPVLREGLIELDRSRDACREVGRDCTGESGAAVDDLGQPVAVRDPGLAEAPERAASTGWPSGDLLDASLDLRREPLRASGNAHSDQRVEIAGQKRSARARARLSNSRHVLRPFRRALTVRPAHGYGSELRDMWSPRATAPEWPAGPQNETGRLPGLFRPAARPRRRPAKPRPR